MLRTFEEMDAMNPTLELEDSHLSENLLEGNCYRSCFLLWVEAQIVRKVSTHLD